MKGLTNEIKRGRPDIIHLALLAICSSPLYQNKKIRVFVHTINNQVITLGEQVRLPKSYHRFQGVIEKLFKEKKIELEDSKLMELENMTFEELLNKIKPENIIGFSTEGKNSTFEKSVKTITDNSCIIIGGFQKGHFADHIKNKFNQIEKLSPYSLETHEKPIKTLSKSMILRETSLKKSKKRQAITPLLQKVIDSTMNLAYF